MPRSTALPHIPVKAKPVQRRITIDPELDANISRFCEFYEAERGVRPDEPAVIVALLRDALERNRAFAKFLREKTKGKTAGKAP
ncbi:DUF2274 domain-containing protein [Xanthomonas theicola]|uniref:DUF2274 domain-containing protein n=1 Tax=Xanthomonas theicola TaxID=56464 RepID=A0A2S6ZGP5_9XANT|nr:DUF2274 domain-containing protein [Xanthomonas theicola]PPT91425.1 hypothetical protein XthCFBP4691_07815 [Xanthomonas theicola]QNH27229.1 DUF2274 domain-containing protein [Xanthomonas theicola]